jgi:hypothetical protein
VVCGNSRDPEALKRESQTIEEIRGLIIKEIPVVEPQNGSMQKTIKSSTLLTLKLLLTQIYKSK